MNPLDKFFAAQKPKTIARLTEDAKKAPPEIAAKLTYEVLKIKKMTDAQYRRYASKK